jgi:4-hydroxyphenylpyruvate dioxygenase
MGFRHAGPHRSKPVQLWEHGELRIVLNHGAGEDDPEVVAIAVQSRDPDRSAARAHALLAPALQRRRGAGEADLEAVAAPDGTAVFFCGPEWLGDFVAGGEEAAEPVPIERIDHITLAQPFEAFDEAGLFYRSVLDLQPSESQELAAPDGLVRSRAVASADGRVRVVLNVPALAGTSRGQGELQHVAFASRDALAAARAMRERGVPLLHVPGNYYDDLAARLELDPALLDELRELGVLYDRDAGGELLHFYTGRIGGRVFFEVLERRGGHSGYGAANSPVRMAAQRAVTTPVG